MSRQLTLLLPGLFGPSPRAGIDPAQAAGALTDGLELSALERLLSCADPCPRPEARNLEDLLFSSFDVQRDGDWPVAAVTCEADGVAARHHWWLRADPVHLHADIGELILTDPDALRIDREEADALAAEINSELGRPGLKIEPLAPQRWYVRLADPPALATHSLSTAIGRAVGPRLPGGRDAAKWHARLNEIQMILHAAPPNRRREERGERPINSVWFWGGGCAPAPPARRWSGVWADSVLAGGLARLAETPTSPLPESAETWLSAAAEGEHLVLVDTGHRAAALADVHAWRDSLQRIDYQWLAPLRAATAAGRIRELVIAPDAPVAFRIKHRTIPRWWRRTRPLSWFIAKYGDS